MEQKDYRLSAIMYTDIVGFSRLMEKNESVDFDELPPRDYILNGCKGREARSIRSLFLKEGELEMWNAQLQAKYRAIKEEFCLYEHEQIDDADIVLISYGSTYRICKSVKDKARAKGMQVGTFRPISLWPFPYQHIRDLCAKKRKLLVVEMSAGQMLEDVRLAVNGACPVFFKGRTGGGIPDEEKILEKIEEILAL